MIGLTLSKNQAEHVQKSFDALDTPRSKRVLLEGWEQFHEPVDRIVSIGAFEHFGFDRYDDFFKMAYEALPAGGTMMLHTIVVPSDQELEDRGIKITMARARFALFMMNEIFPGGRLPTVAMVEDHATKGGFEVTLIQPLRQHYARTLDFWAEALEAHKDEAIKIQSEEVYDRYMKYLTGCANLFREGACDVAQFTLIKPAAK